MTAMPHPYSSTTTGVVSPERASRMSSGTEILASQAYSRKWTDLAAQDGVARLFEGHVHGSESVAISTDGQLLMLDRYGFLHRAKQDSRARYVLQNASGYLGPGRPLGSHVTRDGSAILICNSLTGLLHFNLHSEELTVLSNHVNGRPINYANDLDVAEDGTVYFTSSTELSVALSPKGFYDTMRSYLLNAMRGMHRPSNRRPRQHDCHKAPPRVAVQPVACCET